MADLGDIVIIDTVTRNEKGAAADPAVLNFSYIDPDGLPAAGDQGNADTPFVYGTDAEIVKDSTGHFHINLTATKAGVWYYRWWALDGDDEPAGASEGSFTVDASLPDKYVTISDIAKRISSAKLIQLTDFDNLGFADESKVSECIAAACGTIDSYCGGRYSLPLTVSAQIKDTALSITIYKLHSLRQIAPEKVRTEYEDAISYLRDVAAGKATLDQAAVSQVISSGVVTRNHDTDPEVFDNARLEGF